MYAIPDHTDSPWQKYFTRPEAWEILSPEEQQQLRDLLPPYTPYDAAGRPTFEFLRYDTDWRRGVRVFQEDISEGLYEKEWLEAAELAMKERAEGKFDKWKEQQFEEFWGQNTHVDPQTRAQEMAKVTLERMVKDGEFKVGDVWSYSKSMGRGKAKFLLEKDVTIIEIVTQTALKVAIPPGQQKKTTSLVLRAGVSHPEQSTEKLNGIEPQLPSQNHNDLKNDEQPADKDEEMLPAETTTLTTPQITQKSAPLESSPLSELSSASPPSFIDSSAPSPQGRPDTNITEEPETAMTEQSDALKHDHSSTVTTKQYDAAAAEQPADVMVVDEPTPASTTEIGQDPQSTTNSGAEDDAPVEYVVTALPMLEWKIIEVDGRIDNWDGRGGNQWRTIRCIRNGQDRGTLWQMKERYGERKGLFSTSSV